MGGRETALVENAGAKRVIEKAPQATRQGVPRHPFAIPRPSTKIPSR